MKQIVLTIFVLLTLCHLAAAQTSRDVRSFELTPAAPPTPALKHQLLFDDLGQRQPGNAAILYLQAVLLMGPDAVEQSSAALKAHDANDLKKFQSLAESLKAPAMFQQLELAARREQCDWQPPFREMGVQTLLPHLQPLAQGAARLVKVQALRQIDEGQAEEALRTLRLGYELSDKMGREPVFISGLVSLAVTGMMNDGVARLMSRPESPNLYWALADFPRRQPLFRRALEGERSWMIPSVPNLARAQAGEELSANEWRAALKYVGEALAANTGESPRLDPVDDSSPEVLRQARRSYAQSRRVSEEQAATVEPAVVLGSFYFQQYQAAFDDMCKLRGLPYPAQLALAQAHDARIARLKREQPANTFWLGASDVHQLIWKFARVDRELAALTVVEAIRSYAAAHDGKLPERLDEIADIPVSENPATGKPFEYRCDKITATLTDSQSKETLSYTIKIR